MLPALALLPIVLLALSVCAKPVVIRDNLIRLPFAKKINATNVGNVLRIDQARAAALRAHGSAKAGRRLRNAAKANLQFHNITRNKLTKDSVESITVQNQAVTYVATVGVGSPATDYSLIIDTGSSNTWVGASQTYVRTSTSKTTGNLVSVTYGSGFFTGTEFTDTVTLADGLVITGQSIGDAAESEGFDGVDGILGIGPVDLTEGTLFPSLFSSIPTVTDNLASQGTIPTEEIGVSFEPTTSEIANNGELTFGGTDSSKFTGSITFTPITTTSPSSEFWGIDQSIAYGSTTILSTTAGIVDTGTTLLLIASDALSQYESLTGAVSDETTGLLKVTPAQFSSLQSLFFTIGGTTFEFTANAQAWPRSLNSLIGGTADNVYLIVGDIGENSGSGMDFIDGFAFLERFYAVFDTTNQRVGIATTPFTDATTN